MMHQRFLEYQQARICYYVYGSGPQLAFCLHGYSNNATLFEQLEPALGADFTLIALDLPFHGLTRWGREKMRVEALDEILKAISIKEQVGPDYFLVGFSLGARICICLFNYNPTPVRKMILLAPDGLYSSVWYKLFVRTLLGHRLMAWLLKNPRKSMGMLNWFFRYKLINKTIYSYGSSFVHSKRQSTLLYARWVAMCRLHPNLKQFQQRLQQRKVPVLMAFGKKDQITPVQNADAIRKSQNKYLHMYKWDAGHLLLKAQYLEKVTDLFLHIYPIKLQQK